MCNKTIQNQIFLDDAILNTGPMVKIGGWRERVHDNALTFSEISKQLANLYDLDYFVYVHIMFAKYSH